MQSSLPVPVAFATTMAALERKNARVTTMLEHAHNDPIALLRAGRMLKVVNRDLQQVVQRQRMTAGSTHLTSQAAVILGKMEQHLRCVLLDTASLSPGDLHRHLDRAISQAYMVMDLLAPDGLAG